MAGTLLCMAEDIVEDIMNVLEIIVVCDMTAAVVDCIDALLELEEDATELPVVEAADDPAERSTTMATPARAGCSPLRV